MNKYQAEVLGNRIASEEQILKELKTSYKQALKDIDEKMAQLLGRLKTAEGELNKSTIDYQLNYQKALQAQIKAKLETLNTEQFETISDYLKQSYEDGYIGTMYDIHKQGIPIVSPIEEKNMVKSIKNNTKLSSNLWGSLAEKTSILQSRIRSQISRGIAQNYSYDKIAFNLASEMSIGYNKAARIVRTESHRITQEATMDAQYKAKEKGADIVKQWDASLDKRTRESHAMVDGEIRELDKPFSNGLMFPGDSANGTAEEVVNCRCVLLQRAKWALDEEELANLKERAEFFKLDKTKNFEEYKENYLKASEELKLEGSKDTKYTSVDYDKLKAKYKGNDKLIENAFSNAELDEDTLIILNNIDKLEDVKIVKGKKSNFAPAINELTLANSNDLGAFYHEFGHSLDNLTAYHKDWDKLERNYKWISEGINDVRLKIAKGFNGYIPDNLISIMEKEQNRLIETVKSKYVSSGKLNDDIKGIIQKKYGTKFYSQSPITQKYILKDLQTTQINKYIKEYSASDPNFKKWGCLSDIYDALTSGNARNANKLLQKHGWDYYNGGGVSISFIQGGLTKKENTEIFANFVEMKLGGYKEQLNFLKDNQPDLYNELEGCYKNIANILGGKK